jgi:hypothetical protein
VSGENARREPERRDQENQQTREANRCQQSKDVSKKASVGPNHGLGLGVGLNILNTSELFNQLPQFLSSFFDRRSTIASSSFIRLSLASTPKIDIYSMHDIDFNCMFAIFWIYGETTTISK